MHEFKSVQFILNLYKWFVNFNLKKKKNPSEDYFDMLLWHFHKPFTFINLSFSFCFLVLFLFIFIFNVFIYLFVNLFVFLGFCLIFIFIFQKLWHQIKHNYTQNDEGEDD